MCSGLLVLFKSALRLFIHNPALADLGQEARNATVFDKCSRFICCPAINGGGMLPEYINRGLHSVPTSDFPALHLDEHLPDCRRC